MDNLLASLATQSNRVDFNAVENFRAPNAVGNAGEEEQTPNAVEPLEPIENEPLGADVVELSDESLQLARLETNEGIVDVVEQEATAAAANALNTGTQLPTDETGAIQENLNNPAAPEGTNVAPNFVTDVNAPTNLTTEQPLTTNPVEAVSQGPRGVTETVEAPAQTNTPATGTTEDRTAEPQATTTETAANPAAGSVAGNISGNENTAETETEPGAGEEELNLETPAPPEETGVPGTNAVLNRANGTTPAAPADVTEVSPQTPRSEEQVLLQNVGTQLAQTVPPANIISVLG
jgi:hypothetical protein